MDINDWSQRHKQSSAALDADQIEHRAMLDGLSNIEVGIQDERTPGLVDDELVDKGNSWSERQILLENLTGSISEELERRAQLMNGAYPFSLKSGWSNISAARPGCMNSVLLRRETPKALL